MYKEMDIESNTSSFFFLFPQNSIIVGCKFSGSMKRNGMVVGCGLFGRSPSLDFIWNKRRPVNRVIEDAPPCLYVSLLLWLHDEMILLQPMIG